MLHTQTVELGSGYALYEFFKNSDRAIEATEAIEAAITLLAGPRLTHDLSNGWTVMLMTGSPVYVFLVPTAMVVGECLADPTTNGCSTNCTYYELGRGCTK